MYHYLFTNDLRISSLQSALTKAGDCFVTNTVPSASEDKSENNNMKTLGFYFNLTTTSNCAKECQNGNVRKVVLNFIKKFQFPNPRTQESLVDAFTDGITIAPMRLVLQVLYNMHILYPGAAHLTRDEILNFFFYNSAVAKNKNPNIVELAQQIIEYRKTSTFPSTVERDPDKRNWKHEDRQIREMVKLLLYSGCISENERQELYIKHDDLTVDNKAALFDILTYTRFWMPDSKQNYNVNRSSYENYMDVEILTDASSDGLCGDVFAHNIYGMHIKLQNDALSDTKPHICIGWSKMGDLSDITTRDELDSRYESAYPNEKVRKKAQDFGQIWRFVKEMQIGDYVVFSNGDTCHIGRVVSDYYFDNAENDNQDPDYVNVRDVEWLKKDIRKSDLSEVFQNSLGAAMSVFRLNDYKSAVNDLLDGSYVKDELLDDSEDENIMSLRGISNEDLSIDDLANILRNMYNNPENTGKAMTPHVFGFKYGAVIDKNNYSAEIITTKAGLPESYAKEIRKGINIYKAIRNNEYGLAFSSTPVVDIPDDVNNDRVLGGYNKIYYGAPGCGKSFIVNKMLDEANVPDVNRIRVTFHPEYANCDFVGQILPTIEKKFDSTTGEEKEVVKYIFNPGPFTLALERARKTNDMVYLVIEEINRGNAAAIFGDLFQLLDREKDQDKPNWGESEYPICNVNIQKYLGMGEGKSTVIPSNLTILATMNTSDQSVFTLDTAFKRRWSFEQISNNIEKDTDHKYKGWYVPGTNVTLEKFLTVINAEILKHKITSEDKRMGKYFISKDCLTETPRDIQDVKMEAEMFAYKVLEYIWNDVCKIGKDEWFDTISITTLEDLIDAFVEPEADATPLSVFKSITF